MGVVAVVVVVVVFCFFYHRDSIQDENGQPRIRPIEMDDLLLALEKCKPSATLQR